MFSKAESMIRSHGSPDLSGEADSLLIREDLAEEWGCVIGYLECGGEVRDRLISEQFYEAAQDEIGHITRLTRLLATLDPSQAQYLQKTGLFLLTGFEHQTAIPPEIYQERFRAEPGSNSQHGNHGSKRYFEPGDKTLECLRNAIRDELAAINVYQRQIQATVNLIVRNVLITISNCKKEHVAGFTASLLNLLGEFQAPLH